MSKEDIGGKEGRATAAATGGSGVDDERMGELGRLVHVDV